MTGKEAMQIEQNTERHIDMPPTAPPFATVQVKRRRVANAYQPNQLTTARGDASYMCPFLCTLNGTTHWPASVLG